MGDWDKVIKLHRKAQALFKKSSDYWQECEEKLMVARIKGLKAKKALEKET